MFSRLESIICSALADSLPVKGGSKEPSRFLFEVPCSVLVLPVKDNEVKRLVCSVS